MYWLENSPMGDLSSVGECRVFNFRNRSWKHHLECLLCSSMGPAAVTLVTGAAEPLGSIGVIDAVSSDSGTQLSWRCEGPCCVGECPLSSASPWGLKRLLMKILPQKTRLSQLLWNSLSQSKTICQLNSVSVPCGKITVFPMRGSGYQQHIQVAEVCPPIKHVTAFSRRAKTSSHPNKRKFHLSSSYHIY